ncbi:MAG: SdpI family protein [Oscillospiraceae bacterium]|nr:SdpI family protein [Oscillospiraceae bacterium]
MIRKNLKTLIITSVVTLLPILIGVILWNKLPDTIATHFDLNNQPNGFTGKTFAVFGIPAVLLAFQWILAIGTGADPKHKNIAQVSLKTVFWIIPCLSLILSAIIYTFALGYKVKVGMIAMLILGVIFVLLGNYMPKCKQNYTFGIKIPWTLHSEENWNKTHRLAGKIWVVGGIVILLTAMLESPYIIFPVVIVLIAVPTIYSYCLYRKEKEQ